MHKMNKYDLLKNRIKIREVSKKNENKININWEITYYDKTSINAYFIRNFD